MLRVSIFISLFLLMAGCNILGTKEMSEEALAYDKNYEIIGEEKTDRVGELHPDIFEPAIKEKQTAEENILIIDNKADRPYQVSTGRYKIEGTGTGYVYLYDEKDELVFREYVAYGIEKVQVDIKDTYDFRFNGLEALVISEIEPEITEELTPGIWEVGTHIEPGRYELTGEGYGTITVLTSKEDYDLFELTASPYTPSAIEVELTKNQKVIVSGLSKVKLDPL